MREAFDSSEVLASEVILDEENSRRSMSALLLSDGRDLRSIIGDELYALVAAAISELGLPEAVVRYYKPWALVTLLSVPPPETGQLLDLVLYNRARASGKEVVGLEQVDEQLEIFENLSEADQILLLRTTLEQLSQVEPRHEELLETYLDRDLEGLVRLNRLYMQHAGRDLVSRLHQGAIVRRNARMVDRLLPWLRQRRCFVAVGALHLPGARGILKQLAGRGFKVSRVY